MSLPFSRRTPRLYKALTLIFGASLLPESMTPPPAGSAVAPRPSSSSSGTSPRKANSSTAQAPECRKDRQADAEERVLEAARRSSNSSASESSSNRAGGSRPPRAAKRWRRERVAFRKEARSTSSVALAGPGADALSAPERSVDEKRRAWFRESCAVSTVHLLVYSEKLLSSTSQPTDSVCRAATSRSASPRAALSEASMPLPGPGSTMSAASPSRNAKGCSISCGLPGGWQSSIFA
mmetsp:Transcript_98944/g.278001  ORF Transcript_98944/g.278001 Transcript_98944/m.278001 type:complete len:237 (-) Transcript_98944:1273-1983(-)